MKRRAMTAIEARLNDAPPPPDGTPARTCHTCLAVYLDYADGHDAHLVVFSHRPKSEDAE